MRDKGSYSITSLVYEIRLLPELDHPSCKGIYNPMWVFVFEYSDSYRYVVSAKRVSVVRGKCVIFLHTDKLC